MPKKSFKSEPLIIAVLIVQKEMLRVWNNIINRPRHSSMANISKLIKNIQHIIFFQTRKSLSE